MRRALLGHERGSGKHKRHGMNVQFLADSAGRLVWASPALPSAMHDLTATRTVGLIDALTSNNVMTFADKGYHSLSPFHREYLNQTRSTAPARPIWPSF